MLTFQLSLQHQNCPCTGNVMFICFTFGHLGRRFIGRLNTTFEQRHVSVHSPPDRSPNNKYSLDTCIALDFCKTFYSWYCLVATVIHTQFLCSQICIHVHVYTVYIYTYTHTYIYTYIHILNNFEKLVGKNKF